MFQKLIFLQTKWGTFLKGAVLSVESHLGRQHLRKAVDVAFSVEIAKSYGTGVYRGPTRPKEQEQSFDVSKADVFADRVDHFPEGRRTWEDSITENQWIGRFRRK
eukprot:121715_1